jgi:predicted DNA-binding transcriptional regulator AlpA
VKFLRFKELKERGIVGNWPTLLAWVEHEGFPPGRWLGPNSRAWSEEEVAEWLASRPVERRATTATGAA